MGGRPQTNKSIQGQLHPAVTGEPRWRFWMQSLLAIQIKSWSDTVAATRRRRAGEPAPEPASPPVVQGTSPGVGSGPDQVPADRPGSNARTAVDLAFAKSNTDQQMRRFQTQLDLLERFVEHCRKNDVELHIALSPLHPRNIEADIADQLAARTEMVSHIAPVWDFGVPEWLSQRPGLWSDISHFKTEVGRMMLERMFDGQVAGAGPGFGVLRGNSAGQLR